MTRHKITILFLALALPTLVFPVSPAVAGDDFQLDRFPLGYEHAKFADDFGNSRSGGRHHMGNDIFGEKGSPVVAVADGLVTAIGHNYRSGYYVRIEHRDGWQSWYMHLNNDTPGTDDGAGGLETAIAEGLKEGMYVAAGTVIGYVGDSGNAEQSSPHTHFELHDGQQTVNPYLYLLAARERWQKQQRQQRWQQTLILGNYPR